MNQSETIIVTGGAGFLGRCAVEVLRQRGYRPFVIDNFSNSKREVVAGVDFSEVDLCDLAASRRAFKKVEGARAVIHFAALALVEESTRQPERYLNNNVGAATTVATLCCELGIEKVIHSSSCAVYGVPSVVPIVERSPLRPISPYGESKVRAENVFREFRVSHGLRSVNLRYFNPVGSIAGFGERHEPETHLVPRVVEALRKGAKVQVFGSDYGTSDGTCVRDFIHVKDLIEAHIAAIEWLGKPDLTGGETVNLGSGRGHSVLDVIRSAEECLSLKAQLEFLPRRSGDPASLVADTRLAFDLFGWRPQMSLSEMISDHIRFISNV